METVTCFKCRGPGHYATRCPYNTPAEGDAEHFSRIRLFIDWWIEGRLDLYEKRLAISYENQLHYGDGCPKALMLA